MKTRTSVTLICLMVFVMIFSACSQQNSSIEDEQQLRPTNAEIEEAVAERLPANVSIIEFKIEASENVGDKVDPIYKTRFQGKTQLDEDAFVPYEMIDTVVFLQPVFEKGHAWEIYGTSKSLLRAGAWVTEVSFDDWPFPELGRPLDAFADSKTIIKGTEEEKEYLANTAVMSFVPASATEEFVANVETIINMLQKETGLVITPVFVNDFITVREGMGTGEVQIGLMDTFNYLQAKEKYGVDVALVAERFGSTSYNGQFNVRVDSGITSLEDLKGKVICWVDPNSMSGYVIPLITLKANGIDPDKDFTNQVYASSHNKVITMVYNGECDVGATYADARSSVEYDLPDVKDKITILAITPDVLNESISFAKAFPADKRQKIVDALLAYAATSEGQKALSNLYSISGFQPISDNYYETLRSEINRAGINIEDLAQ